MSDMLFLIQKYELFIDKFIFVESFIKMLVDLEESDFYFNEVGYRVFTESFHLKRGYCCKNGCKHCPYGYDKKSDSFKK